MPTVNLVEKFPLNIAGLPGLAPKFVNTDYFANICHEIRTPLNAILGLSTLMTRLDMNPGKQKECAVMLLDSSNMLAELLNDLLDTFKIDNEKMELEHIVFDLSKVLEEAKNIITVKAKEKGLDIHMRIGKRLPVLYMGDPLRIRQILLNLLSNAVKFTPQGTISLHLAEEKGSDGYSQVSITVADSGIGISKETLSRIFDKYSQGNAGISREYGGTGLGLFISQELAHLMKGHITVKSWPGMGSHFILSLPLQKASVLAAAA